MSDFERAIPASDFGRFAEGTRTPCASCGHLPYRPPYILIGKPAPDGVWSLATATHYSVNWDKQTVLCTHGGWRADFVCDENGRLVGLRFHERNWDGTEMRPVKYGEGVQVYLTRHPVEVYAEASKGRLL